MRASSRAAGAAVLILSLANASFGQSVAYLADGVRELNAITALSNGTFLIGGRANSLAWVPAGVPTVELWDAYLLDSSSAGDIGFVAHLSADWSSVLRVVQFPAGTVRDVSRIRVRAGAAYVSGQRATSAASRDGYFIAKLNGDFVTTAPTGLAWATEVFAPPSRVSNFTTPSAFKRHQPWDVRSDGVVIAGEGCDMDTDWAGLIALDSATGDLTTMPRWPGQTPDESWLALKAGSATGLQSLLFSDHARTATDENGTAGRLGRRPEDFLFAGAYPSNGPGYTGYSRTAQPTHRLTSIVVDPRDNHVYLATAMQCQFTVSAVTTQDVEPAVVAMDDQGQLKWWARLHRESVSRSPAPQFVDALTIDTVSGQLVVLARTVGKATDDLWDGDTLAMAPASSSFQRKTAALDAATQMSWLGKLGLRDGKLHAATWVGDYGETVPNAGANLSTGPLAGWPDPNSGTPTITGFTLGRQMEVDPLGRVWLLGESDRPFTTTGAYQQMNKPSAGPGGRSGFARLYASDLSRILYGTVLRGPYTGSAPVASDIELRALALTPTGPAIVGAHRDADGNGLADGNPLATVGRPSWADAAPVGASGVLGRLPLAPLPTSPAGSILSPLENASIPAASFNQIQIQATDADGLMFSVDVYVNGVGIGPAVYNGGTQRWVRDWNAPSVEGPVIISARMTDNVGQSTWTSSVRVRIGDKSPEVVVVNPAPRRAFNLGQTQFLDAQAEDADGTVTAARFALNGVDLGAAAYAQSDGLWTLPWTPQVAGSHFIQASATDNVGQVSQSLSTLVAVLPVTGGGIGKPWQTQDIGAVAAAGSVIARDQALFPTGSGNDIWNTADEFRYVWVPVTGDFIVECRVSYLQDTDQWAKCGVMVRESTAANARNVCTVLSPRNGVAFQRRTSAGGSSSSNSQAGWVDGSFVRLRRLGNSFTGWASLNGLNWTQIGSAQTVSIPTSALVGVCLTSHNDGTLCRAAVDTFRLLRTLKPSDLDLDNDVDARDLAITAGQRGRSGVGLVGDVDGNGTVNLDDVAFSASEYGVKP